MALAQHPEILERYVCSSLQTQLAVNFNVNLIIRIKKKLGSIPNKFYPLFQNKQFHSPNIFKILKKLELNYFNSHISVFFSKPLYKAGPESCLIQLHCMHCNARYEAQVQAGWLGISRHFA